MQEMSRIQRALLAMGVALVSVGLAGPSTADEQAQVSAPTAGSSSSRGPSERPTRAVDTDGPVDASRDVTAGRSEELSPTLSSAAEPLEQPGPIDVVTTSWIVISVEPTPLRGAIAGWSRP